MGKRIPKAISGHAEKTPEHGVRQSGPGVTVPAVSAPGSSSKPPSGSAATRDSNLLDSKLTQAKPGRASGVHPAGKEDSAEPADPSISLGDVDSSDAEDDSDESGDDSDESGDDSEGTGDDCEDSSEDDSEGSGGDSSDSEAASLPETSPPSPVSENLVLPSSAIGDGSKGQTNPEDESFSLEKDDSNKTEDENCSRSHPADRGSGKVDGVCEGNSKAPWVGLFSDNRKLDAGRKLCFFDTESDDVHLEPEDVGKVFDKMPHCLIGFFAGPFPGKAALNRIAASWKVQVDISFHESGWIIFKFMDEVSVEQVCLGGPYTVLGRPLILKVMPKFFRFSKDTTSKIPVWVQLRNLPLEMWSSRALSKIGSRLGKPLYADRMTMTKERISFARILVEIDVAKEVKSSVHIKIPKGPSFDQPIHYEFLPKFCSKCLVIGHATGICNVRSQIATEPVPTGINTTVPLPGKDVSNSVETAAASAAALTPFSGCTSPLRNRPASVQLDQQVFVGCSSGQTVPSSGFSVGQQGFSAPPPLVQQGTEGEGKSVNETNLKRKDSLLKEDLGVPGQQALSAQLHQQALVTLDAPGQQAPLAQLGQQDKVRSSSGEKVLSSDITLSGTATVQAALGQQGSSAQPSFEHHDIDKEGKTDRDIYRRGKGPVGPTSVECNQAVPGQQAPSVNPDEEQQKYDGEWIPARKNNRQGKVSSSTTDGQDCKVSSPGSNRGRGRTSSWNSQRIYRGGRGYGRPY